MNEQMHDDFIQKISLLIGDSEPEVFDKAIQELKNLDEDTLRNVLAKLLDDPEPQVALGVAKAIGILNCPAIASFLVDLAIEPGKWFSHSERKAIRLQALESLGMVRSTKTVGALLDLLNSNLDSEVEMLIVKALGLIGDKRAVRPLIGTMIARPTVSLSAAGALAMIGGEEALAGLLSGLKHEDEMVRSASVWALGELGDERALDSLAELGASSDEFERRDIVWAIGRIGGVQATLLLNHIANSDPDSQVRAEAKKALKERAGSYRTN